MMAEYGERRSGVWIIIMFLFFIVFAFVVFGKNINITASIHEKIFGGIMKNSQELDAMKNKHLIKPPEEHLWCKIQEIPVPTSIEKYSRDRIVGWDSVENCCVREVSGFNCALKRQSFVQYCYSANIGGEVKWVLVEGFFVDPSNYFSFVIDLDKEEIPNKICDNEKYPEQLIQQIEEDE